MLRDGSAAPARPDSSVADDIDPLADARAAVERGDWSGALDLLDRCGPDVHTAEGYELRAQAAYGDGQFEAAVTAWEDLHALLVVQATTVSRRRGRQRWSPCT